MYYLYLDRKYEEKEGQLLYIFFYLISYLQSWSLPGVSEHVRRRLIKSVYLIKVLVDRFMEIWTLYLDWMQKLSLILTGDRALGTDKEVKEKKEEIKNEEEQEEELKKKEELEGDMAEI